MERLVNENIHFKNLHQFRICAHLLHDASVVDFK